MFVDIGETLRVRSTVTVIRLLKTLLTPLDTPPRWVALPSLGKILHNPVL